MANNKIKRVELKRSKHRILTAPDEIRISVYFDYEKDNHHIQFPDDIDRESIAALFHELAELILTGEQSG